MFFNYHLFDDNLLENDQLPEYLSMEIVSLFANYFYLYFFAKISQNTILLIVVFTESIVWANIIQTIIKHTCFKLYLLKKHIWA